MSASTLASKEGLFRRSQRGEALKESWTSITRSADSRRVGNEGMGAPRDSFPGTESAGASGSTLRPQAKEGSFQARKSATTPAMAIPVPAIARKLTRSWSKTTEIGSRSTGERDMSVEATPR